MTARERLAALTLVRNCLAPACGEAVLFICDMIEDTKRELQSNGAKSVIVWVLTCEYNEYDQEGEYFVNVFLEKPSAEDLIKAGVPEKDVDHVLDGGGRVGIEYQWFFLRARRLLA